jgi:hypothetical protein
MISTVSYSFPLKLPTSDILLNSISNIITYGINSDVIWKKAYYTRANTC